MGSDPAASFRNHFIAQEEAEWFKAQSKLGTINVNQWFIDDLVSLNDGRTFEKHYKGIHPTELELRKKTNSNSPASFLDIYI